ncbi:MAG: hypothetical protein H6741_07505 [Alphaproteobacteria bacterium]|nr:hypothetical protein [Alphaproteobacteria bacterium]MCB9792561.1 hypothetical protein [Alphaproteobacteria bacterium]
MTLWLLLACTPKAADTARGDSALLDDARPYTFEPYAFFLSLRGAWDGERLSAYGHAGEDLDAMQEPVLRWLIKEEAWFAERGPEVECTWEGLLAPQPLAADDPRMPEDARDHWEVWALELTPHASDCEAFDPAAWGEDGDPQDEILDHLPILSFAPMSDTMALRLRDAVGSQSSLSWSDYAGITFATWAHFEDEGAPDGYEAVEALYARAYALDERGDRLLDEEGRPVGVPVEQHAEGIRGAVEGLAWTGLYAWELLE